MPELCQVGTIRAHFAKFILQHIGDFRAKAIRLSFDVNKFDENYDEHIWLFVTPPIWGSSFRPRTSVDAREYGQKMLRAAKSMRKMQRQLWTLENLAITTPDMQLRTFEGNHLAPRAQRIYFRNLSRIINALLCPRCTPNKEYNAGEHARLQYHKP